MKDYSNAIKYHMRTGTWTGPMLNGKPVLRDLGGVIIPVDLTLNKQQENQDESERQLQDTGSDSQSEDRDSESEK